MKKSETNITTALKGPWILSAAQEESTIIKSGKYAWAQRNG